MIKNIPSLFLFILICVGCAEKAAIIERDEKIILDTDMGSDCDDVGALALLNVYANSGSAEILGIIYSSEKVAYGVGVIDAINRYYGNDNIPVGASHDNSVGDPVDKMGAEKLSKDTARFKNRVISNTDVAEQTCLLRELLSSQEDNSVVYITIGHTKGLFDFFTSKPDSISNLSGFELAERKIKRWVALGALGASNEKGDYVKDWNFFFNGTTSYTKHLVDNFPKPIYFVDGGATVMTGKSLARDPNDNIVRAAYEQWLWNVEGKTIEDQRPSWDLVTVLFAVEGENKYFDIKRSGYLDFDIEKGNRWIDSDTVSNHTFVLQQAGTDEVLSDYLNRMISTPNINE